MTVERCILKVSLVHLDLVLPSVQIKLGEEAGTTKFVEQLVDNRNWEHVRHCLRVQNTVVHTEMP
jgi:hypothetical protein